MSKFEINRAFDHKTHGRIGLVKMEADCKSITINGTELPASSVEYLLTFALQNLQDAYAGADSAADAQARFGKKLDRLIAGTIGVREAGDGASAEVKMIRTVLGETLRKTEKGKAAWKAHEDDRAEWLDAVFAKQSDEVQAEIKAKADARLEEQRAKAKQVKALAESVEL